MGMFDYVIYSPGQDNELLCDNCNSILGIAKNDEPSGFQTKDGTQELREYSPMSLAAANDGVAVFYDICDNCKKMNIFEVQIYLTIKRLTRN